MAGKSGSNELHGDLLDYIRNGDLDARNFFSTGGHDSLKRNRFGGTAGGKSSSQAVCVQFINQAAFVQNPTRTYGNVGRNSLHGPGNFSFDLSLVRTFKGEVRHTETRART